MRSAIKFIALTLLSCSAYAFAVDGIAITNRNPKGFSNWGGHGDVWRYDIKENKVVDSTRLFEGLAHWPSINPDGTHIAFLRKDDAGNYVTVIPIDGGDAKNVYTISGSGTSSEGMITWDKNNTIYFSKNSQSKEVFKVKLDGSGYTKVTSIPTSTWIRCWDINVTADRLIIQGKKEGLFLLDFPSCSNKQNFKEAGTCNSAMSASGAFVSGINNSGHSAQNIASWRGEKVYNLRNDSMAIWGGYPKDLQGMDKTNWSCNSDKWICCRVGWPGKMGGRFGKQGTNQVIANWVDKIAIRTTLNNPRPDTTADPVVKWYSEAGDFWVAGLDGNIQPHDAYVPAHMPSTRIATANRAPRISTCGAYVTIRTQNMQPIKIRIADFAGRTVLSTTAATLVRIPKDALSQGTYLIDARAGTSAAASRISILP